jgi:Phosphotransferase enzyme family
MTRLQWTQLPAAARQAIEAKIGPVSSVASMAQGLSPGVAARIAGPAGVRFVKAIPDDDRWAKWHRRELAVGQLLPDTVPTPRLLWGTEADGWIVLAYEFVEGRVPDVSPASADIPGVLSLMGELASRLSLSPWSDAPPVHVNLRILRNGAIWLLRDTPRDELADFHLYQQILSDYDRIAKQAGGDALLQYDVSASNMLVSDGVVLAVDWGFACSGAHWVDQAMFIPRLVGAGHTPAGAGLPPWSRTPRMRGWPCAIQQQQEQWGEEADSSSVHG